jgi:hypothetical protein
MKRNALEFCRRGLVACGFGPIVLAVVYLILQYRYDVQALAVNEVCVGIISLFVLAFIAGGMNFIYQIERLPLMLAILIHGSVLYLSYLATYLLNGWLQLGWIPILVFSCIFVFGYFAIWAVIYSVIKRNTATLNEKLQKKQQSAEVKYN